MATIGVEKLGRVTSASVKKCTGRSWDQWIKILNAAGADAWSHQEIVAFVKKKYRLSLWWQQGVTSGYELHIGRRVEGQNSKGQYSLTATLTFPISAKSAWQLITSESGLQKWIGPMSPFELRKGETFESQGGIFGEVRTVKMGQRARIRWQDTDWPKPSILMLYIVSRPSEKCIVVLQHDQLTSPRLREQLRAKWKQALLDLRALAIAERGASPAAIRAKRPRKLKARK